MKRISSIHLDRGKETNLFHNSRELRTENSIFATDKNEVTLMGYEALNIYQTELRKRIAAYTGRTRQNLQKSTITHYSAIMNLNEHHSLQDILKVANYLEETLDTKVFQSAIHCDEGFLQEDGIKQINYHGHMEMLGIDSAGRSIRKKLTRKFLIDLQTKTAEILKMPRGKRKKKRKRLGTYEYKEAMRRFDDERRRFLEQLNELKSINEQFKKELIHHKREVDELNSRLHLKEKENKATAEKAHKIIAERNSTIEVLRAELDKYFVTNVSTDKKLAMQNDLIEDLNVKNEILQEFKRKVLDLVNIDLVGDNSDELNNAYEKIKIRLQKPIKQGIRFPQDDEEDSEDIIMGFNSSLRK